MAVRRDSVQIDISFITDESKAFAQTIQNTKEFQKELRRAKRNGEDLTGTINQIVNAGKQVEGLDLKKVAPAQLIQRARQLNQAMRLIPQNAPQYKILEGELSDINNELAEMRGRTRGVSRAQAQMATTGRRAFQFLGRALAAVGIAQLGRNVISTTASFEKMFAVLENALGSRSAAQASFQLIQEFAANSPFQVDQILASYIKLVNRGFVPTREELVKIGDLAASQGKDIDQVVEALLDAQVGEFERLKELGIRAKSNGDTVILSFKGQTVEVEKTEEALKNAVLAFAELEGVQGTTAQIAQTLEGRLSNLQDSFTSFLATIGNSGGLGDALGGVLGVLDDVLKDITFSLSDAGEKANVLTDQFLAQQTEVNNLESELNPLLQRYEELTNNSERSFQEQRELEKIIVQIGKITPKAVTEIDKYGNALGINAGRSREFLEAEKARLRFINKEQIQELERLRENTEALIGVEQRLIERKDETFLGFELFPADRVREAAVNIGNYQDDIRGIEAQLRLLNGAFDEVENNPTFDFIGNAERGNAVLEALNKQNEKADEVLDKVQEIKREALEELPGIETRGSGVEEIESVDRERRTNEFLKEVLDEREEQFADYEQRRLDNAQRTAELQQQMLAQTFQSASSFIQSGIDLLGRDEEARKRNATAIKNATKVKIGIDLAAEIQGIWKNANSNITNSIFPGFAQAFAAVQTGLATGRAAFQVAKVNSAKFNIGGFTGPGMFKDETGDRVAGVVHENEWVAPTWMLERFGGLFQRLEGVRQRGFNDGGFTSLNTTPSFSFNPNISTTADVDLSGVQEEIRRQTAILSQTRREMRAYVVYSDITETGQELSDVQREAAL